MPILEYNNLSNSDEDWYCRTCTLPNFSDSYFDHNKSGKDSYSFVSAIMSMSTMFRDRSPLIEQNLYRKLLMFR
jgi:hypothetical protein